MAVGKHLMCCFFYSVSLILSLSLSLSLSKKFQSFFYIIFLSLSQKLCIFLSKKRKSCAFYLLIRLTSLSHIQKHNNNNKPPSKYHQTERDPLKFELPNPHFKPHNTALITFKLHFSLFSNSHNTGFAIGAG